MLRPLFEQGGTPAYDEKSVRGIGERLKHSSSIADKIVAYTFMKKMAIAGWQISLKREMTTGSELFKHFAYELLEE